MFFSKKYLNNLFLFFLLYEFITALNAFDLLQFDFRHCPDWHTDPAVHLRERSELKLSHSFGRHFETLHRLHRDPNRFSSMHESERTIPGCPCTCPV